MDKVKTTFDKWAKSGRAELMEKEHGKNVSQFLSKMTFDKPFSFLDVGCGNGWVVRRIAQQENCKKAIGIDKSKKMIQIALDKKLSNKEDYFVEDIERWKYKGKFDIIFSMESLYYAESIENTLKKIYKLLKLNGEFYCGTDFYSDNKATANWPNMVKLKMHLLSKKEWRDLFSNAGFKTRTKQIKDKKSKKKWKREHGTLFIIGKKSQ